MPFLSLSISWWWNWWAYQNLVDVELIMKDDYCNKIADSENAAVPDNIMTDDIVLQFMTTSWLMILSSNTLYNHEWWLGNRVEWYSTFCGFWKQALCCWVNLMCLIPKNRQIEPCTRRDTETCQLPSFFSSQPYRAVVDKIRDTETWMVTVLNTW